MEDLAMFLGGVVIGWMWKELITKGTTINVYSNEPMTVATSKEQQARPR